MSPMVICVSYWIRCIETSTQAWGWLAPAQGVSMERGLPTGLAQPITEFQAQSRVFAQE